MRTQTIRPIRTPWLVALAAIGLYGCEQPAPPPAEVVLPVGYWQASITLPGGEVQTGIEIGRDGETYEATLINGEERVRVEDVSFADGQLRLRFLAFNNEIQATLIDGELRGTLILVKRFGETDTMPFRATLGSKGDSETSTPPNHDLSGRWAVTFHSQGGDDSSYIGEFAQRGSRLSGTILSPNGDYRFLSGNVRGDDFYLSTFDGAHAYIFAGSVGADGRIENADYWSATSWHQRWSGERNENIDLPDAFGRTFLKPGYDRLEFEFPNEEGVLVSIDDEKYRDKVVIVTIAGTWCPNCNDEARFLAPFFKEYRDQGLEIIALLFEHFEDAELAAEQARRFQKKFDIQYDTLIAGISSKTDVANTLPALNAFLAFPTTIFIDRDGRVREIHTGWTGPATGERYVQLQKRFTELTTALLAEPPNLIESLLTDDAEPKAERASQN